MYGHGHDLHWQHLEYGTIQPSHETRRRMDVEMGGNHHPQPGPVGQLPHLSAVVLMSLTLSLLGLSFLLGRFLGLDLHIRPNDFFFFFGDNYTSDICSLLLYKISIRQLLIWGLLASRIDCYGNPTLIFL